MRAKKKEDAEKIKGSKSVLTVGAIESDGTKKQVAPKSPKAVTPKVAEPEPTAEPYAPPTRAGVLSQDTDEWEAKQLDAEAKEQAELLNQNAGTVETQTETVSPANPYDEGYLQQQMSALSMSAPEETNAMQALYDMLYPAPKQLSPEQQAKEDRRKKATMLIASLGDAFNSLANLGTTMAGAPNIALSPISGKYADKVQAEGLAKQAAVQQWQAGRYNAAVQDYLRSSKSKQEFKDKMSAEIQKWNLSRTKWGEKQQDDDLKHIRAMEMEGAKNAAAIAMQREKAAAESALEDKKQGNRVALKNLGGSGGSQKFSEISLRVPGKGTGGSNVTVGWRIPNDTTTKQSILLNLQKFVNDAQAKADKSGKEDKQADNRRLVMELLLSDNTQKADIGTTIQFIAENAPGVWTEIGDEVIKYMDDLQYEGMTDASKASDNKGWNAYKSSTNKQKDTDVFKN